MLGDLRIGVVSVVFGGAFFSDVGSLEGFDLAGLYLPSKIGQPRTEVCLHGCLRAGDFGHQGSFLGVGLMKAIKLTACIALGVASLALPGVQAKLSPEGEILIKSPGQLVGYYKRPDATAAAR